MRITRLVFLDFGKFHQQEIKPTAGLNLLTGPNECGKTTICRFLRSMLYGLERERGLRARKDDYTKYRPWEYGRYQGILEFEAEGERYRLFRNFLTTEKQVTLTRLSDGAILPEPELFLKKQGLVSEAVFVNTFFVGNFCETEEVLAADLKNYLMNLAGTGGSGVDLQKSLDWLGKQKKEKQRQLPEKEIGECIAILMQKEEVAERALKLRCEIAENLEKQKRLEEEQKEVHDRIKDYIAKQQEVVRLEQKLREKWKAEEEAEKLQRTPGFSCKEFASGAFFAVCGLLGIVGSLTSVLYLLGIFPEAKPVSFGVTGTSFLLGILLCCLSFFGKRRAAEKKQRVGQEEEKKRQQIQDEMICKLDEYEKTSAYLYEQIAMLQKSLGRGYENLKELLPCAEQMKLSEEQLEEQLQRIEATEQRYEAALKLRKERLQEIEALDLAAETLRRVSGELYREYSDKFLEALSFYAQAFTDGAYQRLMTGEDLLLRADTGGRMVELSDVSFGTGEQFYLALRFAAMDVFDPDKKLPVVLDDSFSSFDTQRLESAMLALAKSDRQILLFSCTGREEMCAKGLGITYETILW